jgi:transposase
MGAKLKTYDKEFKKKAIKLALSSSQPISHTAKELGVKESTLYSWVHNNKDTCIEQHGDGGKELLSELAKLRKENARLKEEREILKKAAVFFAKESQ